MTSAPARRPTLAVTLGDVAGIGPEITAEPSCSTRSFASGASPSSSGTPTPCEPESPGRGSTPIPFA